MFQSSFEESRNWKKGEGAADSVGSMLAAFEA